MTEPELEDASRRNRVLASLTDVLVPVFSLAPAATAYGLGREGMGFTYILLVVLSAVILIGWVVLTFLSLAQNSQTIGMAIQRTRVVDRDGGPASFWQSLFVLSGARVVRIRD